MISSIEKKELSKLKNSFINYDYMVEEFYNNPFAKLLIYKEKDLILGYLYYSKIYERTEINQIEVEKSYRNKNVGHKLLEFLINVGNSEITLEVRKDNANAIKLYKDFGFEIVALRRGYYEGIDGFLMRKLV